MWLLDPKCFIVSLQRALRFRSAQAQRRGNLRETWYRILLKISKHWKTSSPLPVTYLSRKLCCFMLTSTNIQIQFDRRLQWRSSIIYQVLSQLSASSWPLWHGFFCSISVFWGWVHCHTCESLIRCCFLRLPPWRLNMRETRKRRRGGLSLV